MKTDLLYAFRNIRNNPTNSIITIFGLAMAIACSLIIYLYISKEYSYDSFHKNESLIYRINYRVRNIDVNYNDVRVEPEIVDQIKKEIPQIDKSAEYRFAFEENLNFRNNYYDVQTACASEDFFKIFSFPFLAGSPVEVLKDPNEVVITRKLADLLGVKDNDYSSLLNQHVEFELAYGNTPFKIVGIIENIPLNSSISFDAVVTGSTGRNFGGCDNLFGYTSVFYMLKDKAGAVDAGKNVVSFLNNYYKSRVEQAQASNMMVKTDDAFVPFVLPLKETYLRGDIGNCFEKSVDKKNFLILIIIALLILVIACSNYAILSLGQYLKKIGDVGIRKALGAQTHNIFFVFFSEGLFLTFFSLFVGCILCNLFIPLINRLTDAQIVNELINIPKVIFFITLLFLSISVITSIVPVLVFSKVSPHQMAGNKMHVGNKNLLSQVFVSLQYSVSIILIIVALFIVRQSNYMKNQSLGLDSNNIIDIQIGTRVNEDKKTTLKEMLMDCPGVVNLTMSCRNFMNGESDDYVNKGDGEQITVFKFKVDQDYIPTLGLHLIRGRNFTKSNVKAGDRSVLVNRKFTEAFGIEDDPVGKTYNISGAMFTIIGVVDDYHCFSLRDKIPPVMLHARTDYGNSYNDILLRYDPGQLTHVIKHIRSCYEKVAPGKALTYDFWNEKLRQRYDTEERWSKIIGYASIIAIIISSLGLFGLTVLRINQKIKEIGIRKVNGARAFEVLIAINKVFISWLIGSLIIAIPVAYLIVDSLLRQFPYKTDISGWIFVLAGTIALVVAILIVSWQSWRASIRNPVETLRYE
jgi:putative ABC transport system permease protein